MENKYGLFIGIVCLVFSMILEIQFSLNFFDSNYHLHLLFGILGFYGSSINLNSWYKDNFLVDGKNEGVKHGKKN